MPFLAFTEHISSLFSEWIRKRSEFKYLAMMLLARQLAYSCDPEDRVSTYRDWYKYQIGEMNYTLKSKDDFQYALKSMSSLVHLEHDLQFINVSNTTAIPAPPYCKAFVTEFKDLSKSRAQNLQ